MLEDPGYRGELTRECSIDRKLTAAHTVAEKGGRASVASGPSYLCERGHQHLADDRLHLRGRSPSSPRIEAVDLRGHREKTEDQKWVCT